MSRRMTEFGVTLLLPIASDRVTTNGAVRLRPVWFGVTFAAITDGAVSSSVRKLNVVVVSRMRPCWSQVRGDTETS